MPDLATLTLTGDLRAAADVVDDLARAGVVAIHAAVCPGRVSLIVDTADEVVRAALVIDATTRREYPGVGDVPWQAVTSTLHTDHGEIVVEVTGPLVGAR